MPCRENKTLKNLSSHKKRNLYIKGSSFFYSYKTQYLFGFAIKVLNESLKSVLKNYDFFTPILLTLNNFVLESAYQLNFYANY